MCSSIQTSQSFLYVPPNLNGIRGMYPETEFKTKMNRLMTKPTKWHVHPAKTQISLVIRPVWSESSLSRSRKLGSLTTHWVHGEDSDQTGQMPRLIWVLAWGTVNLFVLSWGGSNGLTHMFLVSYTWDLGKQCRPRTWCLIMGLHCLHSGNSINDKIKLKKYTRHPLDDKWPHPIWKGGQVH